MACSSVMRVDHRAGGGALRFHRNSIGEGVDLRAGGGALDFLDLGRDLTGSTGTVREYIWLYETEIAPTMASRTEVDRPLAVVNAVNTVSPTLWFVHVDHLNRPKKMTDGAKAAVWDADWARFACPPSAGRGAPYAITGSATLDARFPGQWYQMEAGLHYNWHRHYAWEKVRTSPRRGRERLGGAKRRWMRPGASAAPAERP